MLWMVIFGIGLLTSFLLGRYYCGYICPMNTVMRPANWLARKLNLQSTSTPRWLQSGRISWLALGLSVVVVLLMRRVFQVQFPFLIVWLILAALVTLRYKPAVFHNLICPFGALFQVTGHYSRHSQRVSFDQCIGCSKCVKACPSDAISMKPAIKLAVIDKQICHQCQDCRAVCPVDAIHYQKAV